MQTSLIFRKELLWICCLAIVIAGCKKQGNENTVNMNAAAVTPVGNAIGPAQQQLIGPAGGTITSEDGKLSVVVPPQALETAVTISVQAVESTLPAGLATYRLTPHGLQFKKKAQLVWHYGSEQELGAAANNTRVATQQDDGKWLVITGKSVDHSAHTISVNIEHFSDYTLAGQAFLRDSKTKSPYGVLRLKPNEQVSFSLVWLDPDTSSIFVPIPRTDIKLKDWEINGGLESHVPYMFGTFTSRSPDSAVYKAPNAAPPAAENMIAISAKPSVKLNGLDMTLVKHVTIEDVNSFKWNGTAYGIEHLHGVFGRVAGNYLVLSFPTSNPRVSLGAVIAPDESGNPPFAGYTGAGSYSFGHEKVLLNLTDHNSVPFSNRYGKSVTSGKIEILAGSGTRPGDPIYGRIQGTLKHWPDGPQGTISIYFEGSLSQ